MLTGQIQINEHEIAEYKIYRARERDTKAEVYEYVCKVLYVGTDGYQYVADFTVWHYYGDGAVMLVATALEEATHHFKRVHHGDEEDETLKLFRRLVG